jgi:dipeptidyl aminopeptidase/acylaminoacyl peptidase
VRIPGKGSFLVRYYLVKNRLYQTLVVGANVRRGSPDVQKFFNSFKLQDARAQAKPPPAEEGPAVKQPAQPPLPAEKPVPDAQGRLFLKGPGSDVAFLHYLPDGRLFAGHANGAGTLWSEDGSQMNSALPAFQAPFRTCTGFALAIEKGLAMRVAHGGPVEVWDIGKGTHAVLQPAGPGMIAIWGAALSSAGDSGATAHGDQLVRLWDVGGQKLRATLKGHKNQVSSVAFAPDGKTLVSAGWDNTLKFWDVAAATETASLDMGGTVFSPMWKVAFTPDGKALAVWRNDAVIHLVDPATRARRSLAGNGEVTASAFSPDSGTLAAAAKDGTITLWDVAAGKQRGNLQTRKTEPHALAFGRDGKKLASAFGPDVEVWDLERAMSKP